MFPLLPEQSGNKIFCLQELRKIVVLTSRSENLYCFIPSNRTFLHIRHAFLTVSPLMRRAHEDGPQNQFDENDQHTSSGR
jgi:hypothetical protein